MPLPRYTYDHVRALIPPLNGTLHKGQSGRVGVLGGALEYTGAPYFAAISALRMGADLSHVICSPTAGMPIKSYSPDLIVHPILRENANIETVKQELDSIFSRLHVLIVGPGLGREDYMQNYARAAVAIARNRGMYLVLDADALYMIGKDRSIIQGYRRAVITPNVVEFQRLSEQIGVKPDTPPDRKAQQLSRLLGGVTVLEKGSVDVIVTDTEGKEADLEASQLKGADPENETYSELVKIDTPGGLKRCGGQGDVLSGNVGTFLAWGHCYEGGNFGDKRIPASHIPFLAAVGGSMVTRTASRFAFSKAGRSTITQDLLSEIGAAFENVFGHETQFGGK